MPGEIRLWKVPYPGHEDQCVLNIETGQCPYMNMEGMVKAGYIEDPTRKYVGIKNCPRHTGDLLARVGERQRLHDYQVQVFQKRLDELSESDQVKSLRGEIAVIRMMIENFLNATRGDHNQLLIYSTKIQNLVSRCESLVRSADRLEDRMGKLMDQSSALAFAGRIVEIISSHVEDPELLRAISSDILDTLKET